MLELQKHQREFMQTYWTADKPIIWAGAIRSGKTFGAAACLITKSFELPGNYIVAGKTIGSAMRNIVPCFRDFCKEFGIKYTLNRSKSDEGSRIEIGASKFYLFGANNEASQDMIQGMTASGALLDEAVLMPKSFVVQCFARCSVTGSKILMTLNKGSPHHWIKRELIDQDRAIVVECLTSDNKYIDKSVLDFYDQAFSGHYKKRMIDNEWANPTGAIYNELKQCPYPRSIQDYCLVVDPAETGTTGALLFAQNSGGNWIAIKEYYYTGERRVVDHAKDINKMHPDCDIVIDSAGAAMRIELQQLGRTVLGANKDLEKGIQTTQTAINQGRVKHCGKTPNLLGENSDYIWDEKAAERGEDKPLKKHHHLTDCLRYFCMKHCKMARVQPFKKPSNL